MRPGPFSSDSSILVLEDRVPSLLPSYSIVVAPV